VTRRTGIIFTAGAGLRTFATNPFNTWIALSKDRMLTKRWLANMLSISTVNWLSWHAGYINYILFKAVVVKSRNM